MHFLKHYTCENINIQIQYLIFKSRPQSFLMHDFKDGRMLIGDLRDKLVPFASSRKEKEALIESSMNKLSLK